jgi:uncharacterized protein HemY
MEHADFNMAERDFTRITEINPKYADAYYLRGENFFKQTMYSEAETDFSLAISLKSDFRYFYEARARVHDQLNQPAHAAKDRARAEALPHPVG